MNDRHIEKFFYHVDKFGDFPEHAPGIGRCWNWTAYVNKFGYGVAWNGEKIIRAHRLSWAIKNGDIPPGLCVLHKCDNRKCVNTEHLFLGTAEDNMLDCIRKKRLNPTTGMKHWSCKLSDSEIRKIRRIYKETSTSSVQLASMFGVSATHICRILRGECRLESKNTKQCENLISIPKGKKRLAVRLDEKTHVRIQALWESGNLIQQEIADMFNASQSYISRIVNGKSRKPV
jgi:hypothetical protein